MTSIESILKPSHDNKSAAINPANSQAQKAQEFAEQRTRVPMSVPRTKLTTPEIPGYHLHWINDTPGRILQAQQAGYTFVTKEEVSVTSPDIAGQVLGEGTDLGSRVSLVVGRQEDNSPMRAYLMKLPDELYKADQSEHNRLVDNIHETMRAGKQKVDGENSSDASKRYVRRVSMSSTYSQRG